MTAWRLYIAGPITIGDRQANITAAVEAAEVAVGRGWTPFIPHLNCLWDDLSPVRHDYEFWMQQDLRWLRQCNALLRLPGESRGADREVRECESLGRPVYLGVESLPEAETAGSDSGGGKISSVYINPCGSAFTYGL